MVRTLSCKNARVPVTTAICEKKVRNITVRSDFRISSFFESINFDNNLKRRNSHLALMKIEESGTEDEHILLFDDFILSDARKRRQNQ